MALGQSMSIISGVSAFAKMQPLPAGSGKELHVNHPVYAAEYRNSVTGNL